MAPGDWERVEEIFAAGIAGGEATFETRTPTWEQFDSGKILSSPTRSAAWAAYATNDAAMPPGATVTNGLAIRGETVNNAGVESSTGRSSPDFGRSSLGTSAGSDNPVIQSMSPCSG